MHDEPAQRRGHGEVRPRVDEEYRRGVHDSCGVGGVLARGRTKRDVDAPTRQLEVDLSYARGARSFPYTPKLAVLRRLFRHAPSDAVRRAVVDVGRALRGMEAAWPAGGAGALVEARALLSTLRPLLPASSAKLRAEL